MANKKGVELTFNTIIIAAIVLIVFVVIIAIFTGQMKTAWGWLTGANACTTRGGTCGASQPEKLCFPGSGCTTGQFCCIPLKKE